MFHHDDDRSRIPLVMGLLAGAILLFVMFAPFVRAEAPECTGDRHYDGVACCPAVVTTTTLPDADACKSCCPEAPPCPTVECGSGDTINYITVNRCPEYKYIARIDRCHKRRSDGTEVCPNVDFPRRYLKPIYGEEQ